MEETAYGGANESKHEAMILIDCSMLPYGRACGRPVSFKFTRLFKSKVDLDLLSRSTVLHVHVLDLRRSRLVPVLGTCTRRI